MPYGTWIILNLIFLIDLISFRLISTFFLLLNFEYKTSVQFIQLEGLNYYDVGVFEFFFYQFNHSFYSVGENEIVRLVGKTAICILCAQLSFTSVRRHTILKLNPYLQYIASVLVVPSTSSPFCVWLPDNNHVDSGF